MFRDIFGDTGSLIVIVATLTALALLLLGLLDHLWAKRQQNARIVRSFAMQEDLITAQERMYGHPERTPFLKARKTAKG